MADNDGDSIWGPDKPKFKDQGMHKFFIARLKNEPLAYQQGGIPDHQTDFKVRPPTNSKYSFTVPTGG